MASNVSWIKKIGLGIVKGFEWLASPKGQQVIKDGELALEIAFPAATPVVDLVNVWMQKAFVVEGKAQAAASLGVIATSAQKAEAAIASLGPDVEAILAKYNLLPLSPESMAKINNAVLDIANELIPSAATVPAAA